MKTLRISTDDGRQTTLRLPAIGDQPVFVPPSVSPWLLSVLTGLLLVACFPSLNWNVLAWIACVPLLVAAVNERRLRRAFLFGYLAGAVFLGLSCYWFVIPLEKYGGLSRFLSSGVLVIFAALFGVIFGLFGLIEAWLARRSRPLALGIAPFLWVSLELLRTYYVTGFPWNLLGYAITAFGLRQLASVTAVYGLSFLALSTSALVASALLLWRDRGFARDREAWRIWLTPVLWFALLALINWFSRPAALVPPRNEAYLVQPDVPLDEAALQSWAPWRNRESLNRLLAASSESACRGLTSTARTPATRESRFPGGATDTPGIGPDCASARASSAGPHPLTVWSENPAPFYFSRDPVFTAAIEDLARRTHSYVIFNTINFAGNDSKHPLNSAMVLDPEGRLVMQYDKIHLVPFGEYVPWWAFPGKIGKLVTEAGDFAPGTRYGTAATADGGVGVPICYEDIFPDLVRRLTLNGAGVLVNITDDGWYGDSEARYQHLQMARFRAIENGRYVLRATNDGVTAVIDPQGSIVQSLPIKRAGVLSGRFSYEGHETFYTAHGDVFAWLCATVSLASIAYRLRARRISV